MSYSKIIKAAKAANARNEQIEVLQHLRKVMSGMKPRGGLLKDDRDLLVKRKLERWLTALETNHRPDTFWQDAVDQARRSLLIQPTLERN